MTHHERFPGQGRISTRVTAAIMLTILAIGLAWLLTGCTPTEAKRYSAHAVYDWHNKTSWCEVRDANGDGANIYPLEQGGDPCASWR